MTIGDVCLIPAVLVRAYHMDARVRNHLENYEELSKQLAVQRAHGIRQLDTPIELKQTDYI